jgi:hypothetical protein
MTQSATRPASGSCAFKSVSGAMEPAISMSSATIGCGMRLGAWKSAKVFIFNADTDIEKIRLSGCLSNSCDGAFACMLYQAG